MQIKLLGLNGENVPWLQWSRFKRREDSLFLFVWAAVLLHIIFWVLWHFFIAPYPIALTIPLAANLGQFNFLYDYFWPLANTLVLVLNTWLAFRIYRKDIFASWLLIGANIFLQIVVLAITLFLISFSRPV
ncbi:hypothetical protein A3K24_02665 [candidate division Kazan bacterium RIFCSPHIGHO2_01_FULL_44_14]|uniref:Uncharacterized protein n=1 Tax=candidate division Kazan bacterium RIFCSPLOWO2_01_FULL_45_19 TaxID=1798538 RepID=A0A1F4NQH4_UNCK3|nr:hypothetical protein [uncultured bacterium]OGB73714.1 MAG: hypothetical protein A3K51_02665 [candidate division Kazan bacterium RIFCSPLOWO2_01_FULL_45_19]OGB77959.1 MAG: hypothetical protein A3K24_02665 [candidate division Kazan bacterium RIFCSPHIGHO2_01_FULL_44_14]